MWDVPLKATNGAAIMSPVKDGDYLFAGAFLTVCKGMKLTDKPGAEVIWAGDKKTGAYPVNGQPFAENGYLYANCQNGELRCVELATGKRLWETLDPLGGKANGASTAFIVKNGERFFLFTEKGDLIIARLTPEKYEEVSRAHLLEPTTTVFGRSVVWSHPAFADKCVFAQNDKETVCVSLAK